MARDYCRSCGVKFVDHYGLEPTCSRLQRAINALKVIHTWAGFEDGRALIPEHVLSLTKKTLNECGVEDS